MTQQYLAGELSLLLGELEQVPSIVLDDNVRRLRRSVEVDALPALPQSAKEALRLTEACCWAALEQGDVERFWRCASVAVALREFTISADLVPEGWIDAEKEVADVSD